MNWKEKYLNRVTCGDCLEILKEISDYSVDLIITDPPYIIDTDEGSGFYRKTTHLTRVEKSFGNNFNPMNFLKVSENKAKNGRILWCSQKQLLLYLDYARANNYKWDLQFWHKSNSCPAHYQHLMSDTEYCVHIYKSPRYFNNDLTYQYYKKYFILSVQSYPGHPTPKPLNVIQNQIMVFSKEGDIILDPFIGSGTLGIACIKTNRNFIGVDIEPKYVKIAEARFKKERDQLKLF